MVPPEIFFLFFCFSALAAIAAAATVAFIAPHPAQRRRHRPGDQQQKKRIGGAHARSPRKKISSETSQATPHCAATTPTVAQAERSSRLMVATAAMQGV